MFYPESFIKKVINAYPEWGKKLRESMECGDEFIGWHLGNNAQPYLSLIAILKATSLEELQAMAKRQEERVALYQEWRKLYHEQAGLGE